MNTHRQGNVRLRLTLYAEALAVLEQLSSQSGKCLSEVVNELLLKEAQEVDSYGKPTE